MIADILQFTTAGSPRVVSRAIEDYALARGNINALVVPWESDSLTLRMAVTSVKGDGWAIEHTNLGTIELTTLDRDLTRVAIAADTLDHPEKQELAALFERFAKQLQSTFAAAP